MGLFGDIFGAIKDGVQNSAVGAFNNGMNSAVQSWSNKFFGKLFGTNPPSQQELLAMQLDYQNRLMASQSAYNKDMARYNQQLAKEMLDYSSTQQVRYLKEMGLNPALMYGKGGTGGSTAGAGEGGAVGMPAAPDMTMALQMKAIEAQTQLTQAQATKTMAEAEKIKGVDTEKIQQDIKLSQQELENLTKDWDLKNEEFIKAKYENAVNIFEGQILARMQEKYGTNVIEEIVDKNYQQIQNEVSRMTKEDAENDFNAEFWTKLKEKHVDNAVIAKVAEWRIAEERAQEAKTKAERDEWDFRQEKAFSDLVTDLGGDGNFARTLIKLVKFLLK